eukprot:365448-Chlamydomonas_euryale.AAC.1
MQTVPPPMHDRRPSPCGARPSAAGGSGGVQDAFGDDSDDDVVITKEVMPQQAQQAQRERQTGKRAAPGERTPRMHGSTADPTAAAPGADDAATAAATAGAAPSPPRKRQRTAVDAAAELEAEAVREATRADHLQCAICIDLLHEPCVGAQHDNASAGQHRPPSPFFPPTRRL